MSCVNTKHKNTDNDDEATYDSAASANTATTNNTSNTPFKPLTPSFLAYLAEVAGDQSEEDDEEQEPSQEEEQEDDDEEQDEESREYSISDQFDVCPLSHGGRESGGSVSLGLGDALSHNTEKEQYGHDEEDHTGSTDAHVKKEQDQADRTDSIVAEESVIEGKAQLTSDLQEQNQNLPKKEQGGAKNNHLGSDKHATPDNTSDGGNDNTQTKLDTESEQSAQPPSNPTTTTTTTPTTPTPSRFGPPVLQLQACVSPFSPLARRPPRTGAKGTDDKNNNKSGGVPATVGWSESKEDTALHHHGAEDNDNTHAKAQAEAEEVDTKISPPVSLVPCRKVSVMIRVKPPARATTSTTKSTKFKKRNKGPIPATPPRPSGRGGDGNAGTTTRTTANVADATENDDDESNIIPTTTTTAVMTTFSKAICLFPLIPEMQQPSSSMIPDDATSDTNDGNNTLLTPITAAMKAASISETKELVIVNPAAFGKFVPAEVTMETARLVAEVANIASEDWARRYRFDDILWPDMTDTPTDANVSLTSSSSSSPSPSCSSVTLDALSALSRAIAHDACERKMSSACFTIGGYGSGKTYTLFGSGTASSVSFAGGPTAASTATADHELLEHWGLLGFTVQELLLLPGNNDTRGEKDRLVYALSILEIVEEDVLDDLLRPSNGGEPPELKIRHPDGRGAIVQDLTEIRVDSLVDLKDCLQRAFRPSSASRTDKKERRHGHIMATVKIFGGPGVIESTDCTYIHLVELASPEGDGDDVTGGKHGTPASRPSKSETTRATSTTAAPYAAKYSTQPQDRRAASIRKSLSGLRGILRGLILNETQNSSQALSYRECTLTKLLRRALDNKGSRAVVIGTVCPLRESYSRAIYTLDYVHRLLIRPGHTARSPFEVKSRGRDGESSINGAASSSAGAPSPYRSVPLSPGDASTISGYNPEAFLAQFAKSDGTLLKNIVSDPRQRFARVLTSMSPSREPGSSLEENANESDGADSWRDQSPLGDTYGYHSPTFADEKKAGRELPDGQRNLGRKLDEAKLLSEENNMSNEGRSAEGELNAKGDAADELRRQIVSLKYEMESREEQFLAMQSVDRTTGWTAPEEYAAVQAIDEDNSRMKEVADETASISQNTTRERQDGGSGLENSQDKLKGVGLDKDEREGQRRSSLDGSTDRVDGPELVERLRRELADLKAENKAADELLRSEKSSNEELRKELALQQGSFQESLQRQKAQLRVLRSYADDTAKSKEILNDMEAAVVRLQEEKNAAEADAAAARERLMAETQQNREMERKLNSLKLSAEERVDQLAESKNSENAHVLSLERRLESEKSANQGLRKELDKAYDDLVISEEELRKLKSSYREQNSSGTPPDRLRRQLDELTIENRSLREKLSLRRDESMALGSPRQITDSELSISSRHSVEIIGSLQAAVAEMKYQEEDLWVASTVSLERFRESQSHYRRLLDMSVNGIKKAEADARRIRGDLEMKIRGQSDEISRLNSHVLRLENQIKETKSDLVAAEEIAEEAIVGKERLEEDLSYLKDLLRKTQKEADDLSLKYEDIAKSKRKVSLELDNSKAVLMENSAKISRLEETIQDLTQESTSLQRALEQEKSTNGELRERVRNEVEDLQSMLDDARKIISQLNSDNRDLKTAFAQSKTGFSNEKKRLESSLSKRSAEISQLQQMLNDSHRSHLEEESALKKSLEDASETITENRKELSMLKNKILLMTNQVEESERVAEAAKRAKEASIAELKEVAAAKEMQETSLKEVEEKYMLLQEEFAQSVKRLCEEKDEALRSLQEALHANQSASTEISIVQEQWAQEKRSREVVEAKLETVRKQSEAERVSNRQIASENVELKKTVEQHNATIEQLRKESEMLRNEASVIPRLKHDIEDLTLENTSLRTSIEREKTSNGKLISSKSREAEDLRNMLADAREKLSELTSRNQNLEGELAKNREDSFGEKENLEKALSKSNLELDHLRQTVNDTRRRHEEELTAVKRSLSMANDGLSEKQLEISALQDQLRSMKGTLEAALEAREASIIELSESEATKRHRDLELTRLRNEVQSLQEKNRTYEASVAQLQQKCHDLAYESEQGKEMSNKEQGKIIDSMNEALRSKQALEKENITLKGKASRLDHVEAQLKTLREELDMERTSKRQKEAENASLKSTVKECDKSMEEMRKEVEKLKSTTGAAMTRIEEKRRKSESVLRKELADEKMKAIDARSDLERQLRDANETIRRLRSNSQSLESNALVSKQNTENELSKTKEELDDAISTNKRLESQIKELQQEKLNLLSPESRRERERQRASPSSRLSPLSDWGDHTYSSALRNERELRLKAEEIAAALAARAKAGFEKRNAEITELKMCLSALADSKDAEIAKLKALLACKFSYDQVSEWADETSSAETGQLETNLYRLESWRSLRSSNPTSNEDNDTDMDHLDGTGNHPVIELQRELDEARKDARKYKSLAGKLQRELSQIDQQLLNAAHKEGADIGRIMSGSPPSLASLSSWSPGPRTSDNTDRT